MRDVIYSDSIYFSFGQFNVFDSSVALPGCAWTETHYRQGFARRDQNVSFATRLEFGHADLVVHLGPYPGADNHERIIEVPLRVSSGSVVIGGPEEVPDKHIVRMPSGDYRVVAAQSITGDDREAIDLYFERVATPQSKSRIVVADDSLQPPAELLESVDVA